MHFQNNFRDLLETLLDWDVPQEAIADELSKLIKFGSMLPAESELDLL